MKTCFKIFALISALFIIFLAIIKHVQKCSWKDAMGIMEEMWKEVKANCFMCKMEKEDAEEKSKKA